MTYTSLAKGGYSLLLQSGNLRLPCRRKALESIEIPPFGQNMSLCSLKPFPLNLCFLSFLLTNVLLPCSSARFRVFKWTLCDVKYFFFEA